MNTKGYIYRSHMDQTIRGMNIPEGWYIVADYMHMPVTFWFTLDECRKYVTGIREDQHELGMDEEIEVEWIVAEDNEHV